MESVGIVANLARDAAVACARDLHGCLRGRRVPVHLHPDLARILSLDELGREDRELGASRVLVALGGDGTLLAANRLASPHGTPILGIHVGGPASFGFMTETTPPHACEAMEAILAGRYRVETRLMVAVEVRRQGEPVARYHGLNDLVIRSQARMLKLRVSVAETYIATYAADGIIVATPTGSTAYNLAAGGPLVHPTVESILVTPICPHTLNVRSLLTPAHDTIHVGMETGERDVTLLTVDGQITFRLEPGDQIYFSRSEQQARFISLDGVNFYHKVHTRLRLGERFGS